MSILLQSKDTQAYVKAPDRWTLQADGASDFPTGIEAMFFCYKHGLLNMQIVLRFLGRQKNIEFPVTDARE